MELFNKGNMFKEIALKLAFIDVYITNVNKCKLYDNNIIAEDFFAGLFSIIRSKKFANLNKHDPNAKGVDIGSTDRQIAIQITAECTLTKAKESIKKFKESKYNEIYNDIEIFFIKSNYLPRDAEKYRIFNMANLSNEIYGLNLDKLEKINQYLNKHINLPNFNNAYPKLLENNIVKPKNLNAFLKFLSITAKDEVEYSIEIFNNYIDKLNQITDISLRSFLRLCAECMWQNRNEGVVESECNIPYAISISALKGSLTQHDKQGYIRKIKQLEQRKFLIGDRSDHLEEDAVYMQNFEEWNITMDLIRFAHKNKIDTSEFFDKLDFSKLDE